MPVPPLLPDLIDMTDSVRAFAQTRGFDSDQTMAAQHELGRIIGEGETSYSGALRRVAEFMDDRLALEQRVDELAKVGTVCRRPAEQLRWDLEKG